MCYVDEFLNYINYYTHNLEIFQTKEIFFGYKFILNLSWSNVIKEIDNDEILDLEYNKNFLRGFYSNKVNLNDIPENCERIQFIKGLINLGRKIRKAKSFDEIKEHITLINKFIDVLLAYISENGYLLDGDISKKIKIIEFYELLDYLTVDHKEPNIFFNKFNQTKLTGIFILKIISGYLITIKFLIDKFKIIEYSDLIKKNNLVNLINTVSILKSNYGEISNFFISKSIENLYKEHEMGIPEDFKRNKKKNIKTINSGLKIITSQIKKFTDTDFESNFSFWSRFLSPYDEQITNEKISKQIMVNMIWSLISWTFKGIRQLIQNYESQLSYLSLIELVKWKCPIKKEIVMPFFSKKHEIEEINDGMSEKQISHILDQKLFWYKVDVLEGNDTLFNGYYTCLSLIRGEIFRRKNQNFENKLQIKIFKHEDGTSGDISVAVLMEGYGTIGSDFSGWLFFFNVATYGYHGFGPSLYKNIMDTINSNLLIITLDVIHLKMDILLKYLQGKTKYSIIHSQKDKLKKLEMDIDKRKGFAFEAVVYQWYTNKYPNFEISWGKSIYGEEIDIYILKDENVLSCYECKYFVHSKEEIIKQLIKKKKALKKLYPHHEIECFIVVYEWIDLNTELYFEKCDIKVEMNFKERIKRYPSVFGSFSKLKQYLE
ncbi:hypothetical protein NEF87_001052 [Candidatus Lokiarchaeum ossiferum]|uniref:Restriction endonuclease type IV Mrr domain-containing protein n=1 Tax=Candidatus Lokiarchaeum ossiferum TaxID=2951803 RepID=A0ABY6HQT8_9ARCH|nr:hypothetical protein NEF87_001052 [Candidatus Lokiarchaeum sp. B-35]